jgi:hypothetical protein
MVDAKFVTDQSRQWRDKNTKDNWTAEWIA